MVDLVFMGIQGSGKGTQADMIQERLDLFHISLGNEFRWHIKHGTETGEKVRPFIEKGLLVPDEIVFELIDKKMLECPKGFILDGFPRNIAQAEFLNEHYPIDSAVLFMLPDEKAMERLMARRICINCHADFNVLFRKPKVDGVCDHCGGKLILRSDDNEEAIVKRIQDFHHQTDQAIEYFRKQDKLVVIDADQKPDAIHQDVLRALKERHIHLG